MMVVVVAMCRAVDERPGGLGVGVRRRRGLGRGAAVVVVGALAQVVTNVVTDTVPGWLADPVRNWLVLAVLALLLVLLTPEPDRLSGQAEVVVGVRFGPVPGALGVPALDRPVRGREAELERLWGLGRRPGGQFVVLCAAGGMGKTALATEFAQQARRDGFVVFWIRHRSVVELAGRLEEIAVATGLPRELVARAQHSNADVAGLVWDHLDRVSGWVVVLDNLDRPSDAAAAGELLREYRGWVRPSSGGLVVVTSRDRDPDTWGRAAVRIVLEPLPDVAGAAVVRDAAPDAGTVEELVKSFV